MAVYPNISSVPYIAPIKKAIEFKTLVQEFESGARTFKQKRTYPLRPYSLRYENLKVAHAQILWQFFIARHGMADEFVIFDPNATYAYVKEYVGTGDDSTTVFNLPSLNATSRTLYIDDVAKTETTHWTFAAAGGTDGEDKCTLVSAASAGEHITFSFTGQLKIRCHFGTDQMEFDEFYRALVTCGIPLIGVLNT